MVEPDQTTAILSVIRSFFTAVNTQNWSAMSSYTLANGYATLRRNNSETIHICLADLPARLEKVVQVKFAGKSVEETFEDPEVKVDEDLAAVWARFRVLVEGEVKARGTNVFVLHRMEGGEWKISGLADRNVAVD